ncbi:hypothetical protein A3759_06150 [Thalassolituus sp. HI0120]|nr:hypothetical protein A3759_06150 [Thalassolituus sp. HI0120]
MRILLLSAYDAGSHRYWREELVNAFPDYEWRQLTLPARYFNWRIRGNSLSWAFEQSEVLREGYDLLIATSMVDLSSLRGFVPELAAIPTIVYFHENQFAYPLGENVKQKSVEPQMVNLYTALCADQLVFNSDYNRNSFLTGVSDLLRKLPDYIPTGIVEKLSESIVLPVPISDHLFTMDKKTECYDRPIQLIWNHRWEYDKGPDRLLNLVEILLKDGVDFQISVVGERFRKIPEPLNKLRNLLEDSPQHLRHWGYLPRKDDYYALMADSDVVLSTAIHDYQGVAMLEAVACGCRPLAPNRLAYPGIFGEEYCYISYEDNLNQEAHVMAESVKGLIASKTQERLIAPNMYHFSSNVLSKKYRDIFEGVSKFM